MSTGAREMDPIKYTQEKVLCELQEPWDEVDPLRLQTNINLSMRIAVAEWMAEVCTELEAEPEVFCLAVSCLDRFLSRVPVRRQQLQLVGVACLLVAWKVRGAREVNVDALVRFTADSVLREEILEYEMLVLTKLNWNLPSVVAVDFLHHILQRLEVRLPEEVMRDRLLSLLQTCYIHPSLATRAPQLLAAAAVISTIRPMLELTTPVLDTPPTSYSSSLISLSSSSSSSSTSPPPPSSSSSPPPYSSSPPYAFLPPPPLQSTTRGSTNNFGSVGRDIPVGRQEKTRRKSSRQMDKIIRSIQRVTLSAPPRLEEVLEDLQNLVAGPGIQAAEARKLVNLTPSPETGMLDTPEKRNAAEDLQFPLAAARNLFPEFDTPIKMLNTTPTKMLDATPTKLFEASRYSSH